MGTRVLSVFLSALPLLFSQRAVAQSQDFDEFDLGNEWVDAEKEGGWFTPFTPLFAPDTGGFRLDISGGIGIDSERRDAQQSSESARDRASAHQDYYALATLEIPFDRLFGSGSGGPRLSQKDEPRLLAQYVGTGSGGDESRDDAPRSDDEDASRGTRKQADDAGEHGPDQALDAEPLVMAPEEGAGSEPLDRLTPEAALLIAREIASRVAVTMDGAERRIRSLIRRSRWSGLSPELRLRGVLGFDRATSTEEPVGIYPGDTTVRGGRDSLAEARLTFRLDQLVLGDGEASLERQRVELAEDRRKLVKEALSLFSGWRRASVRAEDVSLPPDDRIEAAIDAESALGELSLLTDGWFEGQRTVRQLSRQLPSAGPKGSELPAFAQ